MKLLIFGGSGRTGKALVGQVLEQGHVVTVFARDPAKVRMTVQNLRVLKGDIAAYDSVESAVKEQDAVLSALGTKPQVGLAIILVIACQVIARALTLSGTLNMLLRIAVPLLILLIFARKRTTLSDGTKNIVKAMQQFGVCRFVCESSLGVGDSKGSLGVLYTYFLIPLFCEAFLPTKKFRKELLETPHWIG